MQVQLGDSQSESLQTLFALLCADGSASRSLHLQGTANVVYESRIFWSSETLTSSFFKIRYAYKSVLCVGCMYNSWSAPGQFPHKSQTFHPTTQLQLRLSEGTCSGCGNRAASAIAEAKAWELQAASASRYKSSKQTRQGEGWWGMRNHKSGQMVYRNESSLSELIHIKHCHSCQLDCQAANRSTNPIIALISDAGLEGIQNWEAWTSPKTGEE